MSVGNNYLEHYENVFTDSNGAILKPFGGWKNVVENQELKITNYLKKAIRNNLKIQKQENIIVVYDMWSHGYFHWVADVLFKLYLIKDELDKFECILPMNLSSFQRKSLTLFPALKIISIQNWEAYFLKKVFTVKLPWQSGYFNDHRYSDFAEWIKQEIGITTLQDVKGKKIYVDRQDEKYRTITNFDKLSETLENYHFEILKLSRIDFFEQIKKFSACSIIMGPHGAGLVNMIFMPKGSVVIEIRNSYPTGNNTFERLSFFCEHKYYPVVRPNNKFKGDFQGENIEAEIHVIEKILCSLQL